MRAVRDRESVGLHAVVLCFFAGRGLVGGRHHGVGAGQGIRIHILALEVCHGNNLTLIEQQECLRAVLLGIGA